MSNIARSLKEEQSLIRTEDRLSRNLDELKIDRFTIIPKNRALVPFSKGKSAVVLYKEGRDISIPIDKK